MGTWKKTDYPGVRYRKHKTRKHGVKFDQYFSIYYQLNGKRKEEGVGWASKGWTAKKVNLVLSELKQAQTTGEGAFTLKEKQELKKQEKEEKIQKAKYTVTFGEYFVKQYFPNQITKGENTVEQENAHFKNWLAPVLKDIRLKDLYPLQLEKVKKNMMDAGRAPRTIQYCFAVFRQCWNQAKRDGIVNRESPTRQVKLPKIENKRLRFLTHDEADRLLEDLSVRSPQVHDISRLSLHTGMRASEIFSLTWGNIDFNQSMIYIMDAKGGDRPAYMTDEVKLMIERLRPGRPREIVFKSRNGEKIEKISHSFKRAVDKLGLNAGIVDRRQKLVFHSLRHTFASWLVMEGEDLYKVQKLMGHMSLDMVQRYAHLAPDSLKGSMKRFEENLKKKKKQNKVVPLKEETNK